MSETATTCKYDREAGEYLTPDGETCDTPARQHCTARKTCPVHLGWGELTCARCVGRTRTDIRQIVERSALMLPEALVSGVNSEAANMAGPGGDYSVFTARRNIDKRWIMDNIHKSARGWCEDTDCTRRHFKTDDGDRWHKRGIENAMADLIPDDDPFHPYSVLTRWAQMLSEDYGTERPEVWTLSNAAAFLERILARVANDEEQDYPLLARELKKCRGHLEAVMRDSQTPERGVPCPTCVAAGKVNPAKVRLSREYPHWCEDEACEQVHVDTDELDVWVCPRNREHWWIHKDYTNRLEERKVGA